MSLEQPLFVYANVTYELPAANRGDRDPEQFTISSRVLSASQEQLRAAGVRAMDLPERLIDDGARGWTDWYRLNWGHPPLWFAATRKLKDPKWRGPDGARLVFEIRCETDNTLVLTFNCNAWGAIQPGKPAVDYVAVKELKGSPDWQNVAVSLQDLAANDPKITAPLANWRSVTEFSISPSGQIVRNGEKVKVDGKPWQGSREIRNLRWEGGDREAGQAATIALSPEEHQKNFNDAIRKSLEQAQIEQRTD